MRKTWTLLCLVLLAVTATGYGQTGLGTIAGKVADSSGGVLPGAEVTATNIDTGLKTQAITSDIGGYLLPNLIPGKYSLTVSAPGFKTAQREGLTVQVGDKITLDFTLEVGEVSQIVNVTGDAPLLRSQDAETGEVVNTTMIQNLPQLNRDPLQLLVLSGNVQGSGERAQSNITASRDADDQQDTRINGGRNNSTDYLVDGISAVTGRAHTIGGLVPSMDGVAEFRVVTNTVSAEYGRVSGGLVTVVTKSGTNDLHGRLFDYNQNGIFNANTWEQNRLCDPKDEKHCKPAFNQNIFGAAIGGPVFLPKIYDGHGKTFFFFNYDGYRFRQGGALGTRSLPTEAMRNGDFTGIEVSGFAPDIFEPTPLDPQRYDEATNTWHRTIRMGGDGQHIPPSRFHPYAKALLKMIPLPNRQPNATCDWCANFAAPQSTSRNSDTFGARLDHSLSDKQTIYGRFSYSNATELTTGVMPLVSPDNSVDRNGTWGLTLNYLYSVSPTTIIDARVGGHYNPITYGATMPTDFDNSSLPMDSFTRGMLQGNKNTFPGICVAGPDAPCFGQDAFSRRPSTAVEAAASLSKILTRHTLKFGYEHRRWYDNQYTSAGGPGNFQFFTLGNATTGDYVNEWTQQAQANAWGAFLMGYSGWSVLTGYQTRALNMNYHAGYVMDDFKVTPKLTLNLGLRWEMETPTTERFDKLVVWDHEMAAPIGIRPDFDWNAMADQFFPLEGSPGWTKQTEADNAIVKSREPAWTTRLPNGGITLVNTPDHPSRNAGSYHPFSFAPRFGVAYSFNDKTVLRASLAKMYLPTTGDPNAFDTTTGNWVLADGANGPWGSTDPSFTDGRAYWNSTFDNPWPNGNEISQFSRDRAYVNKQNTAQASVGAVDARVHQPFEVTWNLGVQRELPAGFMVEANYSGNRGVGLLGREVISRVPKDITTGEEGGDNDRIWSTEVPHPFIAGQTNYTDASIMKLGSLLVKYPYFGTIATAGLNVGTSMYHSLNLRSEKRLSQGMAFLFNYTLSNLKDDVGGPGNNDANVKWQSGGGKWSQSTDSPRDNYGTSIWDEKHRLSTVFSVELPFGRNRHWLAGANPVLDGIVGGWVLAGNVVWRSGRPIVWPENTDQLGNVGAEVVGVAWADKGDQNLRNKGIKNWNQIFYSDDEVPPFNEGILDITKLAYVPSTRTYGYNAWGTGDMTFYDKVRHPGSTEFNLSAAKRFPIFSDGSRYLQFRMEAQNILNMRGFGNIQTDPREAQTFGYITGARYTPRRIQVSMLFAF